MTDMICRKTMMRCQTQGMCSPHGGCQPSVATVGSAWLNQLRSEFVAIGQERDQLKAENDELRVTLIEASEEIATWGAYASDYFQEKHDLAGCVAKFHAAAMTKEAPHG